jgi:menaquinone reductase, molybdopterin-binding-like subunit
MKIDRRSFLSFVVGGAAGTALSPLPWKMTDDLAIWSQNWPWTPDPPNGEVAFVNSACTLCPGGCGITVRKIEDRAVKIEGMKGHPVNDGGICILGLSGLQMLYGPTRVQTPLKRVGSRGEGKWQKISWDKAISEVLAKLTDLRKAGKAHTVSAISGSDRGTVANLLDRFLNAYGSPNFIRTPSIRDTYELTLHMMQGVQASAGFDVENASLILSFGSGIIEGWGSPVRMFKANSRLKKTGGKVIQVDSRLSKTAAKSDKWVPIKPGTEAALALGIAHVIIKESRYNKDFVKNYAFGFNDWADSSGNLQKGFKTLVIESYSPKKVAEITGVDKAVIEALARTFALASKPLAICGRGQGKTPGSISEFMAVHALNALVGNINKQGGIWAVPEPDYIDWPRVEMDAMASAGIQKGRLDSAASDRYPDTQYLLNRFVENIRSGKPYGIEALFIDGANPLYTLPDTKETKAALEKIPFIVSFASYMDETTENADLILPNHAYLERYEDVPQPGGFQKPIISLTRPVVSPQFDTRHLGDVILLLAKGLGGTVSKAFPWNSYEDCLEATLGDSLDVLLKKGYWTDDRFTPPGWKKAFDTKSSKFEFAVQNQNDAGNKTLMPGFEFVKPEGDAGSFPLILVPYDSMRLANGFVGDTPFMIKTVEDTVLKGNDCFVEINPKTAREIRLSEGKPARLETPKGSATVRVHLSESVGPGMIALPRGLGHTAYDDYLAGKGVNTNDLIGPVPDPITGLDAAWGIRAKLSKA